MTFISQLSRFARQSPRTSSEPANPDTIPDGPVGVRAAPDAPPSASGADFLAEIESDFAKYNEQRQRLNSHADHVLDMAAELINEQTAKLAKIQAIVDGLFEGAWQSGNLNAVYGAVHRIQSVLDS